MLDEKLPLYDEAWLRAAVQAEDETGCDIQIGGRTLFASPIDPAKLQVQLRRVKLYSLLFGELKQLLHEVNFGSGADAAYNCGHSLICKQMQSLSPDLQSSLDQFMAESASLSAPNLKAQLRQWLHQLLSESDWQAIADSATAEVRRNFTERITQVA